MDLTVFAQLVSGNDQARVLGVLILANLILGTIASVVDGSFTLVRIGDYARTRLLPVFAVYAVGVLISWGAPTDPIIGHLRDVVFGTEAAVMVALLLSNLKAFGINLPTSVANPLKSPAAPMSSPHGPSPNGATVHVALGNGVTLANPTPVAFTSTDHPTT